MFSDEADPQRLGTLFCASNRCPSAVARQGINGTTEEAAYQKLYAAIADESPPKWTD